MKNNSKQKPIPRHPKSKTKKAGLPPGTLLYTGHKSNENIHVHVVNYKEDFFEEHISEDATTIKTPENNGSTTWIDTDGIHNVSLVEQIGKLFNVHPLVLEDITHNIQRPKLDAYGSLNYLVMRCFEYDAAKRSFRNEQISMVFDKNFLLTFQEGPSELFANVRERLRNGGPRLRNGGSDYLAYALIDSVVDSYFFILEKMGEDIESLEDLLLVNATKDEIHKIHLLRRDLINMRKSVWPLREVLNQLQKNENGTLSETTEVYIKDVYDHTIQVIEAIELYRETVIGLLDVYLSSQSHRMNEVMKVLTIITTIFIPLTFLAGVYGMNFAHFPELKMAWMYPWGFWGITLITLGFMLWFFRRKKWL